MRKYEVAIVGAGPVGLLMACLLAQEGVDVVVYEKQNGNDLRTRAIGIHPPGFAALEQAGVGEQVRLHSLRVEGGEVMCAGRVLASISFDHRLVLTLPQRQTGDLLRARLEALCPGALRTGHEVLNVRNGRGCVDFTVKNADEEQDATAALVIAADGVYSSIRRHLGVRWQRYRGDGAYVMMDVAETQSHARAQLFCEAEGIVEALPLPGGMRRWVVRETPERPVRTVADFRTEIAARTGVGLSLNGSAEPAAFWARQHRAEQITSGRIFLLGDAAHETSPIGGQGMNLGWATAVRVADVTLHSLRTGREPAAASLRSVTRSARMTQQRSAFYMNMGRPYGGAQLWARNTAIRAMGAPLARSLTEGLITMRGIPV